MFGKRINLFKLLGLQVSIDLSWIILAVLIAWSLSTGLFPFRYSVDCLRRLQHPDGQLRGRHVEENTINPRADAVEALSVMHRTGNSRLMVVEGNRLVGVIVLKDMLEWLSLKMDLEE